MIVTNGRRETQDLGPRQATEGQALAHCPGTISLVTGEWHSKPYAQGMIAKEAIEVYGLGIDSLAAKGGPLKGGPR